MSGTAARLVRELGVVDDADLQPLRRAAADGLDAYTRAFFTAIGANPMLGKVLRGQVRSQLRDQLAEQ